MSFFSHSSGISALSASSSEFEALEHVAEDPVEAVEIAFVLHQRRAGEIVEILDAPAGEVLVHRLHQREIFAQRHRDARLLQLVKESRKHILAFALRVRPVKRASSPVQ